MRNVIRNAIIVAVAIALALWNLYPLDKSLRLGKDLRGGVTLVYTVSIGPDENAPDVLERTKDALRKRVDPNGLMEISMVSQGRDRIEISMPLPDAKVKQAKAAFEAELVRLGRAQLTDARIDQAMRLPLAQRPDQLTQLAAGSDLRAELLRKAAAAFDDARAKREAVDAAATKTDELVAAAASADIAYEQSRQAVLRAAISAAEVRRVAEASTRARTFVDGSEVVTLPSPREAAEKRLRAAHPESAADIDRVLALHANYAAMRTTLDDPQDLVRMLKGAGVLSFRIVCRLGEHPQEGRLREELRRVGPRNVKSTDARWFKINQIETWLHRKAEAEALAADEASASSVFAAQGYAVETYGGDYYILCWDTRETRVVQGEGGNWGVSQAYPGADQVGKPAIHFSMNPAGAVALGGLTRNHVGDQMAILLDDEVYTAPRLKDALSSGGIIEGSFTEDEIRYVVRVLSGGSLQAKLSPEPISISSVGPELGQDNLDAGLKSGVLAFAVVAGFMIVYYFGCGLVAVIALLANALLILGAMAIGRAAFTMPGIAGVILTFGMAVDSNVLIYERLREELSRGADLKTGMRLGFDKALAAIVDGNITNLIVCVVLYYTGTAEIRGFAITMGIGVVSTLFAALVFGRLIFDVMLASGWRKTSMLPMLIPGMQRALTPSINWVRLRWVFIVASTILVGAGLGMVVAEGRNMLDNEFVGGTQVTLTFKQDASGNPLTMRRPDVEARVRAIGQAAPPDSDLRKLDAAEVFPVDPQADGVTSNAFTLKTTAENPKAVLAAVLESFAAEIEIKPALAFDHAGASDRRLIPAVPIEKPTLGAVIGRPELLGDVRPFLGGVAIQITGITPPQSLESLRARLATTRQSSTYSDTLARRWELSPLEGSEREVKSAVLLVTDDAVSIFDSETRWDQELKAREWSLVNDALAQAATPASVHNFSAAIASTFRANALAASVLSFILIGIYIWVRFKAPRYAFAAVVALAHDVLSVLGLLALARVLYIWPPTAGVAAAIGLLPFKIDLNAVAAMLTIAGYSLNDTVVVMDRIRENRGKLPHATAEIINNSINQTFSRTIITGGTTIISCGILYVVGGEGMRAFAFTLGTGLIVGTYSSVAVAAPIVWSRKFDREFAAMGSGRPSPA